MLLGLRGMLCQRPGNDLREGLCPFFHGLLEFGVAGKSQKRLLGINSHASVNQNAPHDSQM